MIYHYCERRYGKRIIDQGKIRPNKVVVSPHMDGREPQELSPVVWFTTQPDLSTTVALSTQVQYPDEDLVWVRFCCPDEVAPLTLPQWADKHDYPAELFHWMILSAELGGEDFQDWRLREEPVQREQWQAVEWFNGKQWVPIEIPTGR